MKTVDLTLDEIYALAFNALSAAGADKDNAGAVATTVMRAEQDGAAAHGLFRVPGYAAGLKSGKVNGNADPRPQLSGVVLRCDGQNGYAPLALQRCAKPLANAARQNGTAALTLTRSHHFAALWPETEALAEEGVAALASVCYTPAVAPAGGKTALFGTNPISFAWPRPGKTPLVFDMATAAMAKGEVQIFARDNKPLPPGVGLDQNGAPTTNPEEVLRGVLLPFGGHKGSALALMAELLAAGLVGENFSYEAAENDNKDGAPPARRRICRRIFAGISGGRRMGGTRRNVYRKNGGDARSPVARRAAPPKPKKRRTARHKRRTRRKNPKIGGIKRQNGEFLRNFAKKM